MRADRLVAVLLLLQRKGRVTAAEVAEELEISERTARRDLDALGMAGLPIYSIQGRNGGWALAGGGKTDLSGLSAAEVRALFMLVGPSGASPNVKTALRKLVRALPEDFRDQAEAASTAIHIDPTTWDGTSRGASGTPRLLDDAQRLVITGEQAKLTYVSRERASTSRIIHPLGLAAKGSVWYLLADTDAGLRTFRVDRMTSLDGTGERVVRPPNFVLADAWSLIADEVNDRRLPFRAQLLVNTSALGILRWRVQNRLRIGAALPDGRIEVELRGQGVESVGGDIAGFGNMLEVAGPPELQQRLIQVANELLALYS
jgi:predicted DNA-binding transcriptional regulator YafY